MAAALAESSPKVATQVHDDSTTTAHTGCTIVTHTYTYTRARTPAHRTRTRPPVKAQGASASNGLAVSLLDYGAGNVRSVRNAILR